MADVNDILKALAAPTAEQDIKKDPKGLSYVTARYVMNTLDRIVGPADWHDAYQVLNVVSRPDGTEKWVVECRLTVCGVTKVDVGIGESALSQNKRVFGEPEKTAYSNALKRAAVKFGIARDLYGDGLPDDINTSYFDHAPQEQPKPAPAKKPVAQVSEEKKDIPLCDLSPKGRAYVLSNGPEKLGMVPMHFKNRLLQRFGDKWWESDARMSEFWFIMGMEHKAWEEWVVANAEPEMAEIDQYLERGIA